MSTFEALSEKQANDIYDILVENAGAADDEYRRQDFVRYHMREHDFATEYRFGGMLGAGGKFWRQREWSQENPDIRESWYVTCYPEQETDARRAAVNLTNTRLTNLNMQIGPRR